MSGRRALSLNLVLVVCFVAVAGVAIGFLTVQRHLWLTGEYAQQALAQDLSLARTMAAGTERYMAARVHFIETLAQEIGSLGIQDQGALTRLLQTARARERAFATLFVADRAGVAIAFSPPVDAEGKLNIGKRYGDRPWFQEALSSAGRQGFEVLVGRAAGRPVVAVAAPIRSPSGPVAGVLSGGLDLGTLRNSHRDLDDSDRLVIVDGRGRVIAHSSPEWEAEARDLSGEEVFRAARRQAEGTAEYTSQFTGGRRTAAFVQVPSAGWTIWVSRSVDEQAAKVRGLLYEVGVSALGAFALAIGIALLLSRVLSRPLEALAAATQQMASGRLREPAHVPRHSGIREFGSLLSGFGHMAEALRAQHGDLEAKVAERTSALAEREREARDAAARLARQEEIGRGYGELAALLNSLDRSHILQEGTRKIAASLHAPLAAVYLTDNGAESLRLKTYAALDGGALDAGLLSPDGMPAEVARRQAPVVVAAPSGAQALRLRTGVGELEVAHVAGFPLVHQARLMGVLVTALLEPLTDDTRGFLENAARQLSLALSNAGLFEATRHQSQQMEQLNAALRQASEAKSRFLASMSHELRTPMNGILGFTDILLMTARDPLTDRQRVALEKVRDSGRHLLALINQVLDLAKIEAGRIDVQPEPASLAAIVGEAVSGVEPQAQAKGLELRVVGLDAAPEIVQDRQKVKQVVLNLLSNAVKFTTSGSVEVRVATEAAGLVTVAVADTGIGLRAEDQAAIFEEFRQVAPAGPEPARGTGLGLAISRRLAELLGGSLSVWSAPGEGSVFTLRLPIRFSHGRSAPRAPVVSPRPPAPGVGRVLVIDDDDNVVEIIRAAVADDPIEVEAESSAGAALEHVRVSRPDAIVLDVMLQGLHDGWELLGALKSDPATRDISVVLHSVIDTPERARRLGAADVLAKPAPLPAVRAMLRKVLDGRARA